MPYIFQTIPTNKNCFWTFKLCKSFKPCKNFASSIYFSINFIKCWAEIKTPIKVYFYVNYSVVIVIIFHNPFFYWKLKVVATVAFNSLKYGKYSFTNFLEERVYLV